MSYSTVHFHMRDFFKIFNHCTKLQNFAVTSLLFYFQSICSFSFFFKNDTAKFFILEGLLSLFYSLICVSKLHNEPHNAKRQLAKMPLQYSLPTRILVLLLRKLQNFRLVFAVSLCVVSPAFKCEVLAAQQTHFYAEKQSKHSGEKVYRKVSFCYYFDMRPFGNHNQPLCLLLQYSEYTRRLKQMIFPKLLETPQGILLSEKFVMK